MCATLRDKLVLLEQQFLLAVVANDEAALEDFALELSRLKRHFKAVEANEGLDDSTTLLLSHMSQAITATGDYMLECEAISSDAQTHFANASIPDLPLDDQHLTSTSSPTITPYHLLFPRVSPSGTRGILGQNKLLDAFAYRWLKQNLHNPYLTSTRLQIIGEEAMTSVTQVELWFQEARDSIGWTRLSHEFFRGSINATTTMAKRVYLEHDNAVPFRIAFAFFRVKAFMETLFLEAPALPASLASRIEYPAQALRSVPTGQDHHFK
jgi:hypothetical protein